MTKTTCASCGGSGTRTFTIQSGFQMASTCAACGGSGSVAPPGSNCGTCAGVGKVRERRTVEVKIPPGVDDGMKIRLDGKGDAPLGGKGRNGDLFVRINVQPSKVFSRQGSNLYQNVNVPFYTAILGGRAPVKTLDRDVEVRVPQGTQPGEEMVLRGRGVKKLYKDDHGDLVVRFNVTMPRCVFLVSVSLSLPRRATFGTDAFLPRRRSLTPAQRSILEQFVAETELPGSTAHYPSSSPSPSSSSPSSRRPSPSAAAGAGSAAPPPGDEPQVARPPPREGAPDKPQWWTTMSDDLSSTATDKARQAAQAAKEAKAKVEDKVDEAKERFESVKEEVEEAVGGAAKEVKERKGGKEATKEEEEEKHSLLGDLWKGAKRWFGPEGRS